MKNYIIRPIKKEDNQDIENIIRAIFPEFSLAMVGTAYEDRETPQMFESYQKSNEVYLILEVDGKVVGGAGIKHLKDSGNDVCELQKMYFSPEVRGKGFGKIMIQHCLDKAKGLGYKKCYLESASQLKAAIHLYNKFGFKNLNAPMGNTGHYSCGVWMIKDL
ncbi:GNAT family N-acetyltransferase [Yeosuana sp. MJ-SS3]|uniref:GNAT family N-acetyltransferase n=1 Tax=Gilvirhabdus luticola TaxID=3079858 RepID=A0ABU3UA81_9FLAO|nr:GNAT family N-acetyltransferase [Yeosuana sp. MJ-SS3]MDU8887318.1 GNAT family N-acetyltransferase [Yeosuana sp. MJ-SS3]